MNHYIQLGLQTNATHVEIKKAYHSLVKTWHPDKCKNKAFAQQKLSDINKAYEILGDPEKKKIYDEQLNNESDEDIEESESECESTTTESSESSLSSDSSSVDLEKFKQQLRELNATLGGNQYETDFEIESSESDTESESESESESEQQPPEDYMLKYNVKGADLKININVTLEEVYNESIKKIKIRRNITPTKSRDVLVDVPIKVKSDETDITVMRGIGHHVTYDGRLAKLPGDAMIHIKILPHPMYKRKGNDLLSSIEVTLDEAINGFVRTLKDLNGDEFNIRIDDIGRTDLTHIIPGKGMKKDNGCYGNIIVKFIIIFNKNTQKQDDQNNQDTSIQIIPYDKNKIKKESESESESESEINTTSKNKTNIKSKKETKLKSSKKILDICNDAPPKKRGRPAKPKLTKKEGK
jgi:DnaJ-class molecular chaperone